MRDPEAAIASEFYDHEQEQARDRERRADDWGADSVFATHPRRRFSRRPASDELPLRRHTTARSSRAPHFERRVSGPAAPVRVAEADPPAGHDGAFDAAEAVRGVEAVEISATEAGGNAEVVSGTQAAPAVPAAAPDAGAPEPERSAAPNGRRTVVVTGRPGDAALGAPRAHAVPGDRRRPRPRAAERLGARPDRVAGWAFGLGMLLILIAVGTADAAPL